ncbi:amino acid ABC transporter ATP-binding/permease protein [Amedibacillus sp. YH-ame10]
MRKDSNLRIMLKMSYLVKPLVFPMFVAVVLGVVGFLCAIFIPYFCALLISHIAIRANNFPIQVFFVMLVVLAVLRGVLHYGEQACNHYIAFKLLALIRDKVFKTLRRLAPAKLEGRDAGDLIYLITSDIEALEVFYAHTISPILIAIITSIILLFQFYSMHPIFLIIALVAYIFTGVCIPYVITRIGKEDGKIAKESFGDMSSYTLESLRNLQDILQYKNGDIRLSQMQQKSARVNEHQKKLKEHEGTSSSLGTFAVMIFSLVMFVSGSILYIQGSVSFTTVCMSTVLMLSSFGPVLALSSLSNHLLLTMASARRVLGLLSEKESVEDIQGKEETVFEDLCVDGVHFAYEDEKILQDINYEFKKGEITGILGKSGSGKSTLLKLMMRFFHNDEGTIKIGDKSLQQINTTNLRDMQSYVTQDTVLFQDTIFNNVHIANLQASIIDVEKACKQANIHDFIMSLPKDYATPVSELGDSLSGGEKQRIALARAFLHNANCILLDEPTSNLDALNEAMILRSLQQQKDKTIVLVSHRPGTLKIANRILSLENGRDC